jgi:hypothetical protein
MENIVNVNSILLNIKVMKAEETPANNQTGVSSALEVKMKGK